MTIFYILSSIIITTLYLFAVLTDPTGTYKMADIFYTLSTWLSFIACVYAFTFFKDSKRQLIILFLALGILANALGESTWYYLTHFTNINPVASVADLIILLSYPCFLIALYIEHKLGKMVLTKKILYEPIFYLVTFSTIIISYFGYYDKTMSIWYTISSIILSICILLTLSEYKDGSIKIPWKYIGLGFIFITSSGLCLGIFGFDGYKELLSSRMVCDLFRILGYLFFGYGMLQFVEVEEKIKSFLLKQISSKK